MNGAKKFITGGGYADWFTTAVRTGPGCKTIEFMNFVWIWTVGWKINK